MFVVMFFSLFVMYSGNACIKLPIEDRPEPKYLAEYHVNFHGYYTMPETVEDMENVLEIINGDIETEIALRRVYPSEEFSNEFDEKVSRQRSLSIILKPVISNIKREIEYRFLDGELYFVDCYLKRFDNFCKLLSLERYQEIAIPFYGNAYDWCIVNTFWTIILCMEDEAEEKKKFDLLDKIVCSLDMSLARCDRYRDLGISLLETYKNRNKFRNSDEFKKMSDIVKQMLEGGISLEITSEVKTLSEACVENNFKKDSK